MNMMSMITMTNVTCVTSVMSVMSMITMINVTCVTSVTGMMSVMNMMSVMCILTLYPARRDPRGTQRVAAVQQVADTWAPLGLQQYTTSLGTTRDVELRSAR
jgi:hypothetical protein